MAGPLESPGGGGPPAKPSPPKQPSVVLLADAKITVQVPIPIVFEALVNSEQLGVWWAQDVEVKAEVSERYEGSTSEGRAKSTITATDVPDRTSYTWPIPRDNVPSVPTVGY